MHFCCFNSLSITGKSGNCDRDNCEICSPIVFLISGYYWAKVEINQRTYKARCKIKKNLKLFIAITAVYILYRIMVQCALHLEAVNVINARSFIKLLLFNETDFICTVLWYLLALIYIYILLSFKKLKELLRCSFSFIWCFFIKLYVEDSCI